MIDNRLRALVIWGRPQKFLHVIDITDDAVFGFQYRTDAEKFLKEFDERLGEFNLELHENKTRLIGFLRFAAASRRGGGEGKPDTFDFLGFTHICSEDRNGECATSPHSEATTRKARRDQTGSKETSALANSRGRTMATGSAAGSL